MDKWIKLYYYFISSNLQLDNDGLHVSLLIQEYFWLEISSKSYWNIKVSHQNFNCYHRLKYFFNWINEEKNVKKMY